MTKNNITAYLITALTGISLSGIAIYFILDEKRVISTEIAKRSQRRKFLFPIKDGKITSKYGPRIHPITGEIKHHNGVDIGANEGTPIYSPDDGVVVRVWSDELNGNAVRIRNDEGFVFGFAHLSKVEVRQGQRVKKGEVIGRVGRTGLATGPHLHFSVFAPITGKDIDPLSLTWEGIT
ncbi:MAG: M23 family metallopeptidase [Elusimicrobiota bacterium]|nr:M23 family metallopeptidase [Endomicrobiia bacterium]MDW8165156.1 M23 family metallopeptidase [Elusimicrobiota bacterium]